MKFNHVYFELNKKERAAVLYAVKSFNSKYSHIHGGLVPFLNINDVRSSMGECLAQSTKIEDEKNRPPVPSKICTSIIEKLLSTYQSRLITLDELKVKSQVRRFYDSNIYVTYVSIFDGRVKCRVELEPQKTNRFNVTTKQTHLLEAIQQLTFKFGLYSEQ